MFFGHEGELTDVGHLGRVGVWVGVESDVGDCIGATVEERRHFEMSASDLSFVRGYGPALKKIILGKIVRLPRL